MNARGQLVLACLLAACSAMAQAGDCPEGYRQVGEQREETATEIIVHPLCAPVEAASSNAIRQQFCKAADFIRKDQEGLRALDFKTDSEQFERYAEASREQKAAVQKKVIDGLLDQSLEVAQKGVEAAKSLNPVSVNDAIGKLKAAGFTNKRLLGAMRKVASTQGKPAMAESYKFFVDTAKSSKEAYDTDADMAKEPDSAQLRFLLGALKIMQKNPELGVVVMTAEFGESAAYLGFLNSAVAEQADLTDDKLYNESRLATQLRQHVAAKKQARADWVKAGNAGEPDCTAAPPIATAMAAARPLS